MKRVKKSLMALVAMLVVIIALPATASAKTKAVLCEQTGAGVAIAKDQSLNAGEKTYFYISNALGVKFEVTSWSSSDSKVLKLKKYDKFYAEATALKPGTSTVTAKLANGQQYAFKVTVKKILSTSTTKVSVAKGKSASFKATLNTDKKGAKVTAKVANKNIATVKVSALDNKKATIKITAKKAGSTTITIGNNVDNETIKIKVTVKKK